MEPVKREEESESPVLSNAHISDTTSPPPSLASIDVHSPRPHSSLAPSVISPGATDKRLHISNIPFKWREEDLLRVFSPFGETKQVEIVYNERGSKGFGFVTFVRAEDADRAIQGTFGREFLGRKIEVNEAHAARSKPIWSSNHAHAYQPKPKQTVTMMHSGGGDHDLNNPYSSQISALLMQQKQLLVQQQMQQILATQQQTDLIATVLGLGPSPLGGLLPGSLQYPGGGGAPVLPSPIDPLMLQVQMQLLQQQSSVLPVAPLRTQPLTMPGLSGQLPTVPVSAYTPYLAGANEQSSIGPQTLAFQPAGSQQSLYIPNEATSAMRLANRSNVRDAKPDRFTPY
ncbi:hypothetical protein PFISCL1PPCAC_484 [Pristionchus fissidentatus]|uniref:RRM domain-containing protein n=1 Tax=Pristionchus fissidentatus TaxID=1538716 RepID=A0AAV5UPZ9_9BILA|nr:hypothetical protein PFISCL1PPCAC_484 [Pristionchus fissidentatus]